MHSLMAQTSLQTLYQSYFQHFFHFIQTHIAIKTQTKSSLMLRIFVKKNISEKCISLRNRFFVHWKYNNVMSIIMETMKMKIINIMENHQLIESLNFLKFHITRPIEKRDKVTVLMYSAW